MYNIYLRCKTHNARRFRVIIISIIIIIIIIVIIVIIIIIINNNGHIGANVVADRSNSFRLYSNNYRPANYSVLSVTGIDRPIETVSILFFSVYIFACNVDSQECATSSPP